MYEIYVETCGQNAQNQVNPATFGKVGCQQKNTVFTKFKKKKKVTKLIDKEC